MKKLLISVLLSMSVFFMFACSNNETETYYDENDTYEVDLEDDGIDDIEEETDEETEGTEGTEEDAGSAEMEEEVEETENMPNTQEEIEENQ